VLVLFIIFLVFLNITRSDENGVTIGNYSAYNILTGSMAPAINPGDMVVVKRTERADIQKDDVITFRMGGQLVTHRVERVIGEGNEFITKGDANRTADQNPGDPRGRPALRYDDVIGVVIFTIPHVGNLVRTFSQTSVWIFVPIIFVVIIISLEIAKSVMKKTPPKESEVVLQPDPEGEDPIQECESDFLIDWDLTEDGE
jgi:signal peptidase